MRYTMMATAFAAAALSGCGTKGNQNSATITGTVVYQGKPIKGGNMTFHSDKGIYSSTIDENGRFVLRDAPTGSLLVTVETESINPGPKKGVEGAANVREQQLAKDNAERAKAGYGPGGGGGGGGGPKPGTHDELLAKYTKIPAKYADKTKTDLKIEAVNGTQDVKLELLE